LEVERGSNLLKKNKNLELFAGYNTAFNCSVLFTMTVDYPYCSIQDFLRYKKKTESSINQWHYFSNAEVVNTAYGKKIIIYEHRIIWKGTAEATASTFNGTEV